MLAAVGTALPETMIPIIAIVFGGGGEATDDVGVGAILGAPFMLSTLAMFVTGVGVICWRAAARDRRRGWSSTRRVLGHDIRYFVVAYALAIGAAFLPPELGWLRLVVAVGADRHLRLVRARATSRPRPRSDADELAPLRFHRLDRPAHRTRPGRAPPAHRQRPGAGRPRLHRRRRVRCSSARVERLAASRSASSEILLALVIAPIATELPEKFNSLIWVRQGKDTLAMGNITGAMVFQSRDPDGRRAACFAGSAWTVDDGLAARLPLGRHRLRLGRGDLRADGPARRASTGAACWSAALFYLVYLGLVVARLAGVPLGSGWPGAHDRRPSRSRRTALLS